MHRPSKVWVAGLPVLALNFESNSAAELENLACQYKLPGHLRYQAFGEFRLINALWRAVFRVRTHDATHDEINSASLQCRCDAMRQRMYAHVQKLEVALAVLEHVFRAHPDIHGDRQTLGDGCTPASQPKLPWGGQFVRHETQCQVLEY